MAKIDCQLNISFVEMGNRALGLSPSLSRPRKSLAQCLKAKIGPLITWVFSNEYGGIRRSGRKPRLDWNKLHVIPDPGLKLPPPQY
jgi:hypothetical protein